MSQRTLFIIYNADATVMGKLRYGFKKLSSKPGDGPACAACDITHGKSLSLSESPAWLAARSRVESATGSKVVQLHRDEMSSTLRDFIKTQQIRLPAIALDKGDGAFSLVMSREDLAKCNGDPEVLVKELESKKMSQPVASL